MSSDKIESDPRTLLESWVLDKKNGIGRIKVYKHLFITIVICSNKAFVTRMPTSRENSSWQSRTLEVETVDIENPW